MNWKWRRRLSQPADEHLIELSEFFVIVLIGVAFEATIEPIGEALRSGELVRSLPLLLVFVMTAFRFLVGNYRHLNNPKISSGPRYVLLFDMFWIGFESLVMIFLGSFTSIAHNDKALASGNRYNYLTLLIALAVIDLVWIGLRWLLLRKARATLQWDWIIIDAALVAFGIGAWWGGYAANMLSDGFLWTFFALNLVIFGFDVLGILDPSPVEEATETSPSAKHGSAESQGKQGAPAAG
jgi:hypothetical protein